MLWREPRGRRGQESLGLGIQIFSCEEQSAAHSQGWGSTEPRVSRSSMGSSPAASRASEREDAPERRLDPDPQKLHGHKSRPVKLQALREFIMRH